MNDYATAIRNSNERKERIVAAMSSPKINVEHINTPMDEWQHIEDHLRKNNLSIAEIIRSVAKKLHGVDIPPYNPEI